MTNILSPKEITEEVEFFRDYCGWSERRIEQYLDLAEGTLGQRRRREARRVAARESLDAAA